MITKCFFQQIKPVLLLFLVFSLCLSVARAEDKTIRLATWNIANFWHVPGEYLRPAKAGGPGLRRSKADYHAILNVLKRLGADVLALQEMASPDSVRSLFPAAKWEMVFSERFERELKRDPDKLRSDKTRDIYTALVVRKGAARIIRTERLALNFGHTGRSTREGVAALLDMGGKEVWVVSLHLKSGCFTDNSLTRRPACRVLAKQIPLLEEWMDKKSAEGYPVVLMGDFNRQLDRGKDVVRSDLNDGDPVRYFKVPHRQKLRCSVFKRQKRVSIDYIWVNEKLWSQIKVPKIPNIDIKNRKISDHCPVYVDLMPEGL